MNLSFFSTDFDTVETHIDLPFFSPILSTYLDGKKVKQYILIVILISAPECLPYFITLVCF